MWVPFLCSPSALLVPALASTSFIHPPAYYLRWECPIPTSTKYWLGLPCHGQQAPTAHTGGLPGSGGQRGLCFWAPQVRNNQTLPGRPSTPGTAQQKAETHSQSSSDKACFRVLKLQSKRQALGLPHKQRPKQCPLGTWAGRHHISALP